jgi:hypothetical protein
VAGVIVANVLVNDIDVCGSPYTIEVARGICLIIITMKFYLFICVLFLKALILLFYLFKDIFFFFFATYRIISSPVFAFFTPLF